MEYAKAIMVAKYKYRMAIQEARTTRCNQLHELETAHSEAIRENAVVRSTQTAELQREHAEHMHKLKEQALRDEVKSCEDFLSTCQAVLHHTLQPNKENLSTSYHIVLGQLPSLLQSLPFTRTPPGRWAAICSHLSLTRSQAVPMAKQGDIFCHIHREVHPWMKLPLRPHRKDCQAPKEERLLVGSLP